MAKITTERCLLCGQQLRLYLSPQAIFSFKELEWPVLCQNCQSTFSLLEVNEDSCNACGRHLQEDSQDKFKKKYDHDNNTYCFDCLNWLKSVPVELMNHKALYDYNDALREWIVQYKYQGDIRLARVMKPILKESYKKYRKYKWVILPSSPQSLQSRRFHPVAYILDLAKIPYTIPFDYVGDGVKQAQKNKEERMKLKQSYQLNEDAKNLSNQKILVFDDIYTTGATLIQAKRLLSEVPGIDDIISLSIGRDQLVD